MTKAFAPPTIHFKGSGWAKKDRSSVEQRLEPLVVGEEGRQRRASGSSGDSGSSSSRLRRVERRPERARSERGSSASGSSGTRLGAGRHRRATDGADRGRLDHPRRGREILEAANIRFRPETIGGWARAGKLQSIKLGGRRFVRRGEVRALVAGPRRVRADDLQPGPVRGAPALTDAPPGPSGTPAWVQRLLSMVQPLFGNRRVIRARLVLDRFDVTGGGLLAAGIAFNALFAIIPLAIFASGVIGILVKDPTSQEAITDFLTGLAPPLASFLDTAIGDLANASTSLTIIGLIGAAWGTTRLYASVELGIQAMFTGVKARSLVAKTLRRAVFIVVIAGLIAASIVAATVGSVVLDRATTTGVRGGGPVGASCSRCRTPSPSWPILVVYLVVPPVRPPRSALWPPAIGVGVLSVAITQVFTIVAPRLVGGEPVLRHARHGVRGARVVEPDLDDPADRRGLGPGPDARATRRSPRR